MFVIANINVKHQKEIERFKENLPKDIEVVQVDVKIESDLMNYQMKRSLSS